MNRRLLGKEQVGAVKRQVAVDLVSGHLMVARDAVFAAGIHERGRAHDVGLQEDARVLDGAVYVALRREIDNDVWVLLLKEAVDGLAVADVRLDKAEIRVIHHRCKRGEVARVGQLVQTDNAVVRVFSQHVEDEVASDESGTAGYYNCVNHMLSLL